MKLKLYLNAFLFATATLLLAAGCDDKNEPNDPDAPTFAVSVSNIAQGSAVVNVTPKDASATYFYGATPKAEFNKYASETEFLAADLKRIEKLAAEKQMTLTAYLEANAGRGTGAFTLPTYLGKTGYYAYAYGINIDGTATTEIFKVQFMSDRTNQGPDLTTTMKAGNTSGDNKESVLTMSARVTGNIPATSARALFMETHIVEYNLSTGKTYESLIKDFGSNLDTQELALLHGEGYTAMIGENDSETLARGDSYTAIFSAIAADGTATVKHAVMETEVGDLQLTLSVNEITSTSAKLNVRSNENYTLFYVNVLTAEEYATLGGTPETAIPAYLAPLWSSLHEKEPDKLLEQVITKACRKQAALELIPNLTPGTNYYAFAVPVNYKGLALIPAVVKEFTTLN